MYINIENVNTMNFEYIKPLVSLRTNILDKEKIFGKKAIEIVGKINNYYNSRCISARYKTIFVETDSGLFTVYYNFVKGCPCFVPLSPKLPFITSALNSKGFLNVQGIEFEMLDRILQEVNED